jgi:DNA-binding response OmpR family regulator
MKKRILVVEDDSALARVLRDNFEFEGFEVEWVADGNEAINRARTFAPDLVVLDVMLPGRDGFTLCTVLRQGGRTPIVLLSARSQKADKLKGLHLGADDYVTKPFDLDELLARVHAVLRRTRPSVDQLELGPTSVDFRGRVARRAGREMHLTHREFELLRYLAERHERVVHRDELLREVWGYPDVPTTRSVDHAIARLRKKIEPDPHHPQFIHTVQGSGYCLTPQGRSAASEAAGEHGAGSSPA